MAKIELCPECGVPRYISDEFLWLNGGVIVQKRDPAHRVVFVECENIDPLFEGIQEIIGMPIERLVIDSRRRGARDYVLQFLPEGFKETLKQGEVELEPIIAAQLDSTRMMGFGNASLMGVRFEDDRDDYVAVRVAEPFSVPLWCGSLAGGCEAIVGGEWGVDWERVSDGTYEIRAFRSQHPPDLRQKALRNEYVFRPGDVELERCDACGGPAVFSRFRWQLDRGYIGSAYTDRRVCINGETGLQEVFLELEKELGEAIPHAVIEAQHTFTKGGFYSIEGLLSEADFRTQFAFRGLGNLSEFRMGATGLRMRLENPTLHLTVVGFAQALFELAFDVESSVVTWKVADDTGDLLVEVNPGVG